MAKLAIQAVLALSVLCLVQGRAQQTGPGRRAGGAQPAPAPPQPKASAGAAQPKPRADYVEASGAGHYKVHAERVGWREAQAACEAEGAHLLVINSRKEAAAVRQLLQQQAQTQPASPPPAPAPAAAAAGSPALSDELHAGFFLPDYFVTAYGTPLSSIGYQKWASDQQHTQICGSINHAALLYDAKCTDKRSFICEFKKETKETLKLADPPILLPDSTPQEKYKPTKVTNTLPPYVGLVQQGRLHYYRVSEEKMRWSQANRVCQDEGGHLLVINHQFEANSIKEYLKKIKITADALYVGLRNGPNKFVTLFGKTLLNAGYYNWESEQPEDETCIAVDQNMLLKKIPCWEEREFVCERTLV